MVFFIRMLSDEAMTIRPYSQKSVFDLEEIFKFSNSDVEELRRLSGELTFRNTQRARSLAVKVEDALTALASTNQVEAKNSDASIGRQRIEHVSDPGIAETMQTATDDNFEFGPLPSFEQIAGRRWRCKAHVVNFGKAVMGPLRIVPQTPHFWETHALNQTCSVLPARVSEPMRSQGS